MEPLLLEPDVFTDERGHLFEAYNKDRFDSLLGHNVEFVQDNHSYSATRGVLRGLHYQLARPQGKLVWVTRGEVFDVSVDIRRGSPTFGRWFGTTLSADNGRQLWIPPGFAHGLLVRSAERRTSKAGDDHLKVVVGDRSQIDEQLATLGMNIEYLEASEL